MQSIAAQSRAQLGGLDAVFFVEHDLVATWPPVVAGQLLAAPTLAAGAKWGYLASTYTTPALDDEGTDTEQGLSFAQKVTGTYAGSSPLVQAQLRAMSGRRYLVAVRYFDGRMVIAGDELAGLLFTRTNQTGKKPSERLATSWQFEAATSTPAAYLQHPLDVEGLGLVTPGAPMPSVTPPAGGNQGSGTVQLVNRQGVVLATVPAGKRVVIDTAFAFSYWIL